jgi:hypothetical protein
MGVMRDKESIYGREIWQQGVMVSADQILGVMLLYHLLTMKPLSKFLSLILLCPYFYKMLYVTWMHMY